MDGVDVPDKLGTPYCFLQELIGFPAIKLALSRRRSDPENGYVLVADRSKPESRLVVEKLDISSVGLSNEFVKDCLTPEYSYTQAVKGFHPTEPFLKNCVIVKHKQTVGTDVQFTVFFVVHEDGVPYLKELYQFYVTKKVKFPDNSDNFVFTNLVFDRSSTQRIAYYAYRLHYRSERTGRFCVKSLRSNIVIA